ncbi:sporulation integral membrane protein YtvI [Alkalihalobacterium bogoriense]|uniref:sporulation integral membrane protein YtvI n=1 Tax=Alkalihalobacterium bogoriense TaxID=246272 RepID=UPI00047A40D1|nr:sporulation integral membrane protein YtvI [Alkalihalobacterium bogoriense]
MDKKFFGMGLRLSIVLLSISIVVISLFYITTITYPFLFGFILAFFMNPIVSFFQYRLKMKRTIAVLLTLFLLIGTVSGLLTLFITEIISGSNYLATVVPLHIKTLITYFETFFITTILPFYESIIRMFNTLDHEQQSTIMNYIQSFTSQIGTTMSVAVQKLFNGLSDLLLSLPNLATVFIFTIMSTFFISKDWLRLTEFFKKVVPQKVVNSTTKVLLGLKQAFFGYLLAQLTLISMTCAIVLTGLLFIKVDYPITVAIVIAIVDLIPYLGTGLIFIPWIIYSFVSGDLSLTIGLSILYGIVVVQRQLMEPKVLSSSIGLDPLATLISLFVGFQLFGLLGLMIGPALLILLKTLYHAHVFHDLRDFVVGKK